MSYVYRRAGLAMMITSVTTCSAFLCCFSSPLAMTKSFGLFAALVIWFDYMLVMTMFCTAVVVYHDYFESPKVNCCVQFACVCCCPCVPAIAKDQTSTAIAQTYTEGQVHKSDRITEFYKGPISNFVINPKSRMATLCVLTIFLGVMLKFMTELKPTEKAEEFLSDDHPLQKAITILNEGFPVAADDRGAHHYYVWGIEEVDRTGVSQMFDPENIGKSVLKDGWNFNPTCQQKVVELCDKLRTDVSGWKLGDHVKIDSSGMLSVTCWPMEMVDWTQNGNGTYSNFNEEDCDRGDQTLFNEWPITENFDEAMARFAFSKTCSKKAENPTAKMMDAYTAASRNTGSLSMPMGWDGERLQYLAISVESSVLDPWSEIAEDKARAEYDYFTNLKDIIDNEMGMGGDDVCGKVIMTDVDQKYIIMNNQKIFRTSAVQGALIGCLIAFVVILAATKNVIIAALSSFNILAVLVGVVGFVTAIGWTLNTTTAILISILAGFSVDYVVHLAHAFVETPGDNEAKIRGSFSDMGVSVFSGMLTSVVASLPLFLCTIKFFSAFGTFLCCTIGFSWVYANFFFMGLMASVNTEAGRIGGDGGGVGVGAEREKAVIA